MALIKFYLKDPLAVEETPLFARYYYQGRVMKIYLGEKIHPRDWNPEK